MALAEFDDPDEFWYCVDCQSGFDYCMSRKILWSYGGDKIIECPECESSNTYRGSDLSDWCEKEDKEGR